MKAFVFIEENLAFVLEGDEKAILKYMSAFSHGADYYAGYGIETVFQNEDGSLKYEDTTDPVSEDYAGQIINSEHDAIQA